MITLENVKSISSYEAEWELFDYEWPEYETELSDAQLEILSWLNDIEHFTFTVLNSETVIVSDMGTVIQIFSTMDEFKRATLEEVNRRIDED